MSNLPVAHKDIQQVPKQVSYTVLPAQCARPGCEAEAAQEHHVVPKWFTRKWKERDWALLEGELAPIKIPLCFHHHEMATRNQASVTWHKGEFLWRDHRVSISEAMEYRSPLDAGLSVSPAPPLAKEASVERDFAALTGAVPLATTPGEEPSHSTALGAAADDATPGVPPGETCETCGRKVPHPRKAKSPTSVTKAFRIPVDEAPAFTSTLEACQEYLGTASQPFSAFKTLSLALGLLLQDESLRGFAERPA